MASNAIQRRNADEQSDSTESTNRGYCIICSEYTDSSSYSLHVRRWDGRYVATAPICHDCVNDEHIAWHHNHVTGQYGEEN